MDSLVTVEAKIAIKTIRRDKYSPFKANFWLAKFLATFQYFLAKFHYNHLVTLQFTVFVRSCVQEVNHCHLNTERKESVVSTKSILPIEKKSFEVKTEDGWPKRR